MKKSNVNFLKYVSCCGDKQRKGLLKHASPEEVKSICECVFNVYKRNVPISKRTISKLYPFRKTIVKIGKNPKSPKAKRLIQQKGGAFLPILISSLLPTVLSMLKE